MKKRSTTKLIPSIAIFISGYTPLFLIMLIKDIHGLMWFSKPLATPILGFTEISFPFWFYFSNPGTVILLILVSGLSLLMLRYVLLNISRKPFPVEIVKARSRSSEVVNYTIPYMISFVAFDLSKWQDLVSLIIFLSILCLLSIRSQSIFINPILSALGYGLYDCEFKENSVQKECVMLSKSDLASNTNREFTKINNYMGIVAEKGS